jgi:hypothetical protein
MKTLILLIVVAFGVVIGIIGQEHEACRWA